MSFLFKKVLLFVPFVTFFTSTCISFSVTGLSTSRQLSYPFQQRCRDRTISTPTLLRALEENNKDSDCGNENDDYDRKFFESNIVDFATDQKEMIKELEWRSNKVALEEANTRAFQKRLKSRPWKLPYDDARKWVQANLGVETKEEYYDLVANGNLRTPYIPKEPEKYYTVSGTWISWNHFLNVKTK